MAGDSPSSDFGVAGCRGCTLEPTAVRNRLVPLLLVAFLGVAAPSRAGIEYDAIRVSRATPVGPNRVVRAERPDPPSLNSLGDVVGRIKVTNEEGEIGDARPFFFDRSKGTITNLGHPDDASDDGYDGGESIWAYDVNDLGWVAGGSHLSASQPFVWYDANTNGYRDGDELLILDFDSSDAMVNHINNAGQILINDDYGGDIYRAQIVYTNGGLEEVGARLELSTGGVPNGLDERGNACWTEGGQGYRWVDRNTNNIVDPSEVATLSSPFNGTPAGIRSMSNGGHVLGTARSPLWNKSHGFVWTDANANDVQEPDETVLVSTNYYSTNMHCWAVNRHGQVAGSVAPSGVPRWAFVWDEERDVRNLNDLFVLEDPELGTYWANQAYGINDFGQIAVYGHFDSDEDTEYAVLLSPLPRIDAVNVEADVAVLELSGLTLGTTATVESCENLVSNDWAGAGGFIPATVGTNWTGAAMGSAGFYRLEMEVMP